MATPFISTPFLILSTLFILLTTTSSHPNNYTDLEALLAFKKSIHDDQQHALSSWNETTHFCRWNGVTCSKKHPNRVISVILWSQGLVGSLSPHIGNLSFLRIIDLQNNTFSGPIPQEIGRLRRIRVVELGNNFLGGGIPSNLSRCMNLYYLNLVSNELTGGIVPEIASLVNLQSLGLSRNMLSGTIPPFLGNLTDLFRLSLSTCSLQGEIPESIARLRKMRLLIIGDNDLTGSIPFSLYNLTSVEVFAFAFNRLHGNIPSDIGSTLPKLRILYLHSNHFTGALPASLSNSSQIERVALSMNSFTGNILIDFTRLSALEKFLAEYNRFNGDIDSIGNLSDHLFLLTVRRNQLSGIIPSSIGNLVDLSYNNLSGSIPPQISKLSSIAVVLNLSHNVLTGTIPSEVGTLRNLAAMDLSYNRLSGTIPTSLGSCVVLSSLRLGRNALQGEIPESLRDLRGLEYLDLSHNNLSGLIPKFLVEFHLLYLNLSFNVLEGDVPTLGVFRNESAISLEGNQDLCGGIAALNLSSCPSSPKSNKKGLGSSSSAIKGTIGYIAPEYGMSYVASTQGDVYSYGVLVLEMFTNRRPTSDAFEGCLNLQDFVSTALTDRVMEVVDPFFHRELNVDEKYWDCIVSILRIGVRCSKQLPRDRMSMTEVVNDLKKIRNVFPVYRNGRNVAL
ncbi:non-specific serine/threonine protein kinase [Salvia divinorum]|uniref:non-specific serine/threonine protein kinase n=1 Tax=Salvia divinorum TaxID=28513 RepID=A0ABD1FPM9_SALDI